MTAAARTDPTPPLVPTLLERALQGQAVLSVHRKSARIFVPGLHGTEAARVAHILTPTVINHARTCVDADRHRIATAIQRIFAQRFPQGGPSSDRLLADLLATVRGAA